MDYTGFIRYYYVTLLKKLNQYSSYKGTVALLNYPLGIENENLHRVDANFDGLPNFALNINAPISDYEKFFDYYSNLLPDMVSLFAPREILHLIYEKFVFGKNDGREEERIDTYIESAIAVLVTEGIIVNGNEI